jgi:hypothetical protein
MTICRSVQMKVGYKGVQIKGGKTILLAALAEGPVRVSTQQWCSWLRPDLRYADCTGAASRASARRHCEFKSHILHSFGLDNRQRARVLSLSPSFEWTKASQSHRNRRHKNVVHRKAQTQLEIVASPAPEKPMRERFVMDASWWFVKPCSCEVER